MHKLGYFYWDPDPAIFDFNLPLLHRPILWYGFFFALGFFIAYKCFIYLLSFERSRKQATQIADRLILFVIIGTLLGARIGELLFYQDWRWWISHPLSVFYVWEGGLSSHGAAIGILVALMGAARSQKSFFLSQKRWIDRFKNLLDWVVIPVALAAVFIRIGNFFNQEIVGTPTQVPWAVLFGHPADGRIAVPRHPVQLYEALVYLLISGILWRVWKYWNSNENQEGRLAGLFLLLTFTARFLLEFFKEEQSIYLGPASWLTMGQILSLPMIFLGLYLFLHRSNNSTCMR